MGAPVGNKNATKNKPWEEAIRRALLADDGKKLRVLAERLIEKAEEGDMAALKEIGDRLDGKPHQSVSGPDGGPLEFANVTDTEVARRYAFALSRAAIQKASATSKESA